jgi:chromosome segregation ATPase
MNGDGESESSITLERLKIQNEKLRNELKRLTMAMQNIKKKKQKKNPTEFLLSDISKDPSTATTNIKIRKLKEDITKMKKELEGNLNILKITELENHSKFLSKRIEELESEETSLRKVKREQNKALDSAQKFNSYPDKISALKDEIRKAKEEYRELISKQKEDEKVYTAQHEKCVDLEEKSRKLYEMIKKKRIENEDPKKKKDSEELGKEVNESDIRAIEQEIKKAEQAANEKEAEIKKSIKDLETQIRNGKYTLGKLQIELKEKDQECRASVLKIKEVTRLMNYNKLKPIQRTSGKSTKQSIPSPRNSQEN